MEQKAVMGFKYFLQFQILGLPTSTHQILNFLNSFVPTVREKGLLLSFSVITVGFGGTVGSNEPTQSPLAVVFPAGGWESWSRLTQLQHPGPAHPLSCSSELLIKG